MAGEPASGDGTSLRENIQLDSCRHSCGLFLMQNK